MKHRYVAIGCRVWRFLDQDGDAILVAECTSLEAARAALRLMMM